MRWSPAKGDRFMVPDRDLDDEVFVVSDMVVEAVDVPKVGRILAFNGTTEWALDSLEAAEAIWLPREDQLAGCSATRSSHWSGSTPSRWGTPSPCASAVTVRHVDVDAEAALARALLQLLNPTDG